MVGLVQPQLIILSDYKYPWQDPDLNRFGPETPMFWTKDRGAIRVTVRRAGFKLNWMLGEKRSKDFKLR